MLFWKPGVKIVRGTEENLLKHSFRKKKKKRRKKNKTAKLSRKKNRGNK